MFPQKGIEMIKKIFGVFLAIGLAIGWTFGVQTVTHDPNLTPPSAEAASYIQVCNYRYSDDAIVAYNKTFGISKLVWPGDCTSIRDDGNTARVDIDWDNSASWADIDSWMNAHMDRWGGLGDGWRGCNVGEPSDVNPFSSGDSVLAASTMYYTFEWNNCNAV